MASFPGEVALGLLCPAPRNFIIAVGNLLQVIIAAEDVSIVTPDNRFTICPKVTYFKDRGMQHMFQKTLSSDFNSARVLYLYLDDLEDFGGGLASVLLILLRRGLDRHLEGFPWIVNHYWILNSFSGILCRHYMTLNVDLNTGYI